MHKICWAYPSNANLPQCIPFSKREASSADLTDKIIVNPRPVHINEGMEVLTGLPAGKRQKDGSFPQETVNRRMEEKLRHLLTEAEKIKERTNLNAKASPP